MIKIFLDDVRTCPEGFVAVKTANECIELLKKCNQECVVILQLSLDHDLGDTEKEECGTGYDVACFLEEQAYCNPDFRQPHSFSIHSDNPVGIAKMHACIKQIEKLKSKIK